MALIDRAEEIVEVLLAELLDAEIDNFEEADIRCDVESFVVVVSSSSSSSSLSSSVSSSCAHVPITVRSSAITLGSGFVTSRSIRKVLTLSMAHLKSFSKRLARSRFISLKRFVLTTQGPPVSIPPLSLKAFSKLDLIVSSVFREEVFIGGLTMSGPTLAAFFENKRSAAPNAIPSDKAAELVGLMLVIARVGIILDDDALLVLNE